MGNVWKYKSKGLTLQYKINQIIMNIWQTAKEIKRYIVDLAVEDKLPMDLTQLDTEPIEAIITEALKTTQIINVIEKLDSGKINVKSFVVPHKDDNQHPSVREAEEYFKTKAKENEAFEGDLDILAEEGYYEFGTYELYLVWSD